MGTNHEISSLRKLSNSSAISNEFELLARWFEICTTYQKLHNTASAYYRKLNYMLMIPITTLLTFSGGVNLGLSFYKNVFEMQVVLGVFGIFVGMLSSVYNFMEIPRSQETHSLYAASFEKHARGIEMELVISSDTSKTYATLGEYIKILKNDIDKLVDTGPFIPAHILQQYKNGDTRDDIYENISNLENQKMGRRSSVDVDDAESPEISIMTRTDLRNIMIPTKHAL